MIDVAPSEFGHLLKRMPAFELSYETMNHKKDGNSLYDIGLAIPSSKKYILWFSFYQERDVCLLMELNREKRIVRIQIAPITFPTEIAYGTLFYGSCLSVETDQPVFLIEDILWYCGISLQSSLCNERLAFANAFFGLQKVSPTFRIRFAHFFKVGPNVPPLDLTTVPYDVHHLQYRSFSKVAPYMNMPRPSPVDTKPAVSSSKKIDEIALLRPPPYRMSLAKPQYKMATIFYVTADLAFDIYHLQAYGRGGAKVYYGLAYIDGYKTSVSMNSIFRNIKENRNLDAIEESDDEEEFQNQETDRFVDLDKVVTMECVFSPKFKRWIPKRLADKRARVVHISML
jgi:hypothetical protein